MASDRGPRTEYRLVLIIWRILFTTRNIIIKIALIELSKIKKLGL